MEQVWKLENFTVVNTEALRNNLKTINQAIRNSLPANAMVITYTYQPLVGITSQTDPQGITTYYEYDTSGRLKEIYLMEGNTKKIVRSHEYNY
ncbi:MAG: RHS repeat protein, partial [Tannerellaceae bacterium]|nr:RHS repeat protein [Tannerellaceae bacterium]